MVRQAEQRQQDTKKIIPAREALEKLTNYWVETPDGKEKKDRSTEAIQGYLQRQHLSTQGSREELTGRLREAASRKPEELEAYLEELERIEQVVQTLRTYPRPATVSFLHEHKIGASGDHEKLLESLSFAMYAGKPTLPNSPIMWML